VSGTSQRRVLTSQRRFLRGYSQMSGRFWPACHGHRRAGAVAQTTPMNNPLAALQTVTNDCILQCKCQETRGISGAATVTRRIRKSEIADASATHFRNHAAANQTLFSASCLSHHGDATRLACGQRTKSGQWRHGGKPSERRDAHLFESLTPTPRNARPARLFPSAPGPGRPALGTTPASTHPPQDHDEKPVAAVRPRG